MLMLSYVRQQYYLNKDLTLSPDLILYMILQASSATLVSPVGHVVTTEYRKLKCMNFGYPSTAQRSRENS